MTDGALAPPTEFTLEGTVLDGRGDAVLTGVFEDVNSVRLDVRDAASGDVVTSVAKDWCGGEGAEGRACVLLDRDRLVRTSTLWAGAPGGSVVVSSMLDGRDLSDLGVIAGLVGLVGTDASDVVLLSLADGPMAGAGDLVAPTSPSGIVKRMDLATGSTTELGAYPEQFTPLCAVGQDSLLGYTSPPPGAGKGIFTLAMVGRAWISPALSDAAVGIWPTDPPRGCSADGGFVFAPARGSEGVGLERIALADGSRTVLPGVVVLPEELLVVTR